MFDVRLSYPMGDDWPARDDEIEAAAGRPSDFAGAGCGDDGCARDHGWHARTFADAAALRDRLAAVPGVSVSVRESTTYDHIPSGGVECPRED